MMLTWQHLLTYGLLTFALAVLWLPAKEIKAIPLRLWQLLCLAALACGLLFGYIQPIGLLPITVLALSCYCTGFARYPKSVRIIAGTVMLLLSVALSQHLVPGFANPKIIDSMILSKGGSPYSRYLNFDKILVGLFILGFTFNNLLATPQAWRLMCKRAAPVSAGTIFVLLLLSFALGYVRFDPKYSALIWFWAWTNLFFTCIAEDAVYRGVVQRYLIAALPEYRYREAAGLLLAAVLFGLTHYPGGAKYILLSTAAGLGYGWTYLRTGQIEASILTHFSLNCLHFLLFTYPALASAAA